jgi:signal transduction histidine kinase
MEEARRTFLAAIGHDLRTPLTSLRTGLEALEDGLVSDVQPYLAAMRSDVTLMGQLVEDLFLLARIESRGITLDLQRVDLAEIADEAIEAMSAVAEQRGVALAVEADGPAFVTGAASELSRVLRNLLSNAIRHAPAASTVTVHVEPGERGVRLAVTDEGPGFSEDFRERAFESFTRSDEARSRDAGGAGLGLAIARGLVDLHHGTIRALAGPGGKVEVNLPTSPEPTS